MSNFVTLSTSKGNSHHFSQEVQRHVELCDLSATSRSIDLSVQTQSVLVVANPRRLLRQRPKLQESSLLDQKSKYTLNFLLFNDLKKNEKNKTYLFAYF